MTDRPIPNPPDGSPWLLLVLDRDVTDPKWLLCSVLRDDGVRPATLDAAGRYTRWHEATRWVTTVAGHAVTLHPVHDALAWRLDDRRPKP